MSLQNVLLKPLAQGSKYDFGHLGIVLLAVLSAFVLNYGPAMANLLTSTGNVALATNITQLVGAGTLALTFIAGLKRQWHPDSQAAIDDAVKSPGVTVTP